MNCYKTTEKNNLVVHYFFPLEFSFLQGETGAGTNMVRLRAVADGQIQAITQEANARRDRVVNDLVGAVSSVQV